MKAKLTRFTGLAFLVLMTLAVSVNAVFAQEEVEAAEASTGSAGFMIAILGFGIVVILGLGFAMNAQAKSETQAKE